MSRARQPSRLLIILILLIINVIGVADDIVALPGDAAGELHVG